MSGARNRVLLNSDWWNGVQSLELFLIEMTGPVLAHGHNQTVSPYFSVQHTGRDNGSLPLQSLQLGIRPMILRSVL